MGMVTEVTTSVSPTSGAAVSLRRTSRLVFMEPSTTPKASFAAVGGSFTGCTVTATIAVAWPPLPSLTV
jgi:hypothetical protein